MREIDALFSALKRSRFRQRFYLKRKEMDYLCEKGMHTILLHAEDFVRQRLAPALIANDGKQTPFRGHPVFVAQHATACCCRGCLETWHRIPQGRALSADEQAYVVAVLRHWLQQQQDQQAP